MKAKCKKCGDTVEVTWPREFKTCGCDTIGLDYGDGENYFRAVGNPEDFDGKIENTPRIRFADDSIEKAANIIGKENIGGESSSAKKVKETYYSVSVVLCEDGTLFINDIHGDKLLAEFKVVEEK